MLCWCCAGDAAAIAGTGATVGGQLFSRLGGQRTFQLGAVFAAANCLLAAAGWSLFGRHWGLRTPGSEPPAKTAAGSD